MTGLKPRYFNQGMYKGQRGPVNYRFYRISPQVRVDQYQSSGKYSSVFMYWPRCWTKRFHQFRIMSRCNWYFRGQYRECVKALRFSRGNVETSQRIVDVLLGPYRKPAQRIPPHPRALWTISLWRPGFTYYETIGAASAPGLLPTAPQVFIPYDQLPQYTCRSDGNRFPVEIGNYSLRKNPAERQI